MKSVEEEKWEELAKYLIVGSEERNHMPGRLFDERRSWVVDALRGIRDQMAIDLKCESDSSKK